MKMFPYTILNNISSQKYAPKSIPEPPDLACRHFLEAGAESEGVSQKIQNMKVSPFTITNQTFLSMDALNATCRRFVTSQTSIISTVSAVAVPV